MRIIKIGIFAGCLFFLGQTTFAQDKIANELKIYTNYGWNSNEQRVGFDSTLNSPIIQKNNAFDLGYVSPAIAFSTKRGNFHELELSRLQINQSDGITEIDYGGEYPQIIAGEKVTNIFIALRYEYNLFFIKKDAAKKWHPSVGFAARPFYSRYTFNPKLSTVFSSKESNTGVLFSIVPRIAYNLSERWYLDLNVPINAGVLKIRNRRVDDPAIPQNQRSITTIDAEVFPSEYLVRFGVGLRL